MRTCSLNQKDQSYIEVSGKEQVDKIIHEQRTFIIVHNHLIKGNIVKI